MLLADARGLQSLVMSASTLSACIFHGIFQKKKSQDLRHMIFFSAHTSTMCEAAATKINDWIWLDMVGYDWI